MKERQLLLAKVLEREMLDLASIYKWDKDKIIQAIGLASECGFEVANNWGDPITLKNYNVYLGYKYEGEFADVTVGVP